MRVLGAVCLCAAACSDSSGIPAAESACLDTADAVAKAAQRCGMDYKATYDGFVISAANGSCSNVVSVRDEAALRNVCLPSIAAESCSDLFAGTLDPSCQGQLLHSIGAPMPAPLPAFAGVDFSE